MSPRVALAALCSAWAVLSALADSSCPADREQPLHNEAKLHTDLLCAYNSDFRPVKDHTSTVTVKVRFALKYISFDDLEETFNLHSWVALVWKDEFLSWNPSDYGGITETQIESHEVWTPRMSLFNADASQYPSDSFYSTCLLASDGVVTCVPHVVHSGICRTSLRRWPYDTQNCTLYFGSWMHSGEQVNFTFYKVRPVVLDDYQNGPGWSLEHVDTNRLAGKLNESTYPMLKYTFVMKREAAGPAAIVVAPSIVIILLTLVSLLLDIRDNVRLMMLCFSLFGHFNFLSEIGYDIPKHSADTPIILLFIRDSMVITLTAIMVTLLLMSMRRKTVPAPGWIVSINRLVSSGPGKYVVFTEFDASGAMEGKIGLSHEESSSSAFEDRKTTADWIEFANLMNSCVFIVVFIVYFVLTCTYIPYN